MAATGKVASPDGTGEKRIVGEYDGFGPAIEADSSGRVARRMEDLQIEPRQFNVGAVVKEYFSRFGGEIVAHHQCEICLRVGQHLGIRLVNGEADVGIVAAEGCDALDMVDMAVRKDNAGRREGMLAEKSDQLLGPQAGVYDEAVFGVPAGTEDVAIGLVEAQNQRVYLHVVFPAKAGRIPENGLCVNALFGLDRVK